MGEGYENVDWKRWLDDHASRFLLFARQKARCDADAEDLVQEALAEVLSRCGAGRLPEPALVFATIRRRAIDLARREDRRSLRETAVAQQTGESWFDTTIEDRERAQLIQEALGRLPEMYREVVVLKLWGDLTFDEISQVAGIPANTAASRYRYALDQLRRLTRSVAA